MPNKNYIRSRARELQVKHQGEKEGWFTIRAAGSHGVADVIWIRPIKQSILEPDILVGYDVKFIQIKVSEHIKEKKIEIKREPTSCGIIEVEYWKFPIRKRKK